MTGYLFVNDGVEDDPWETIVLQRGELRRLVEDEHSCHLSCWKRERERGMEKGCVGVWCGGCGVGVWYASVCMLQCKTDESKRRVFTWIIAQKYVYQISNIRHYVIV